MKISLVQETAHTGTKKVLEGRSEDVMNEILQAIDETVYEITLKKTESVLEHANSCNGN